MQFSVLMSVYKKEKPEYFKQALDSVLNQTLMPEEIILMRDGPVPEELQKTINEYLKGEYKDLISYYPLKENVGLGRALRIGVRKSKYDYVARMDTDDIAVPNRFELQVEFLNNHPEVSVCGGQIYEFIDRKENIVCKREVPLEHEDIVRFMKSRNAFSHMTVMFKKQDVIDSGNYKDMYSIEDYYLWCRMLASGNRFANLPNVLVYARTGKNMYQRRGGYKYYESCKNIARYNLKEGFINRIEYSSYLIIRFFVHVILSNSLRGVFFREFTRNCSNKNCKDRKIAIKERESINMRMQT